MDLLAIEAVAELISSKRGLAAAKTAVDHAVQAGHFSCSVDALQRLFEWGTARNHIKLLQKLQAVQLDFRLPLRLAVDPSVGSPREVWDIIFPYSLARRSPLEGRQFVFNSTIMLILSGCVDTVRFLCKYVEEASLETVARTGPPTDPSGPAFHDLAATLNAAVGSALEMVVHHHDVRTLRHLMALRPEVFTVQCLQKLLLTSIEDCTVECARAIADALVRAGLNSMPITAALVNAINLNFSSGSSHSNPPRSKQQAWGYKQIPGTLRPSTTWCDTKLTAVAAIVSLKVRGRAFFSSAQWSPQDAAGRMRTAAALAAQRADSAAGSDEDNSHDKESDEVPRAELLACVLGPGSGGGVDALSPDEVAFLAKEATGLGMLADTIVFVACSTRSLAVVDQIIEAGFPEFSILTVILRAQRGETFDDSFDMMSDAYRALTDPIWQACPLSPEAAFWVPSCGFDVRTLQGLWAFVVALVRYGSALTTGGSADGKHSDLDALLGWVRSGKISSWPPVNPAGGGAAAQGQVQDAGASEWQVPTATDFLEMVLIRSLQCHNRVAFNWWIANSPEKKPSLILDEVLQCCNSRKTLSQSNLLMVLRAARQGRIYLSAEPKQGASSSSRLTQLAIHKKLMGWMVGIEQESTRRVGRSVGMMENAAAYRKAAGFGHVWISSNGTPCGTELRRLVGVNTAGLFSPAVSATGDTDQPSPLMGEMVKVLHCYHDEYWDNAGCLGFTAATALGIREQYEAVLHALPAVGARSRLARVHALLRRNPGAAIIPLDPQSNTYCALNQVLRRVETEEGGAAELVICSRALLGKPPRKRPQVQVVNEKRRGLLLHRASVHRAERCIAAGSGVWTDWLAQHQAACALRQHTELSPGDIRAALSSNPAFVVCMLRTQSTELSRACAAAARCASSPAVALRVVTQLIRHSAVLGFRRGRLPEDHWLALHLLVCQEMHTAPILPLVLAATPQQMTQWLGSANATISGAHCRDASAWSGMQDAALRWQVGHRQGWLSFMTWCGHWESICALARHMQTAGEVLPPAFHHRLLEQRCLRVADICRTVRHIALCCGPQMHSAAALELLTHVTQAHLRGADPVQGGGQHADGTPASSFGELFAVPTAQGVLRAVQLGHVGAAVSLAQWGQRMGSTFCWAATLTSHASVSATSFSEVLCGQPLCAGSCDALRALGRWSPAAPEAEAAALMLMLRGPYSSTVARGWHTSRHADLGYFAHRMRALSLSITDWALVISRGLHFALPAGGRPNPLAPAVLCMVGRDPRFVFASAAARSAYFRAVVATSAQRGGTPDSLACVAQLLDAHVPLHAKWVQLWVKVAFGTRNTDLVALLLRKAAVFAAAPAPPQGYPGQHWSKRATRMLCDMAACVDGALGRLLRGLCDMRRQGGAYSSRRGVLLRRVEGKGAGHAGAVDC